jgi:hypothetical protein
MSEKTKHTPGPWTLGDFPWMCQVIAPVNDPDRPGLGHVVCKTWSPDHIASYVGFSRDEQYANARLIAAAPDLLAVLKEVAECSEYWSEYDVPLGIHERIAAAIAKAEGEQ